MNAPGKAGDLEQLRRDGFQVLISLLEEDVHSPRYDSGRATALGFTRHNIPVEDFQPPTVAQVEQFVRLIAGLPPGVKVIVHCEAGVGRTGTFAAAYWVAKGLTVPEAIARVRKARSGAVETPEQEAALRNADGMRDGHEIMRFYHRTIAHYCAHAVFQRGTLSRRPDVSGRPIRRDVALQVELLRPHTAKSRCPLSLRRCRKWLRPPGIPTAVGGIIDEARAVDLPAVPLGCPAEGGLSYLTS